MNRGRLGRTLAIGMLATCLTVLNTGCINRILQNAIVGFGFSLGALPAQIVSDFIFGSFTGNDNTTTQ